MIRFLDEVVQNPFINRGAAAVCKSIWNYNREIVGLRFWDPARAGIRRSGCRLEMFLNCFSIYY